MATHTETIDEAPRPVAARNTAHALKAVAAVLALALAVAAGYGLAVWRGMTRDAAGGHASHVSPSGAPVGAASPAPDRQVLYWYDPMKPDARFDKPGRSPFMDMDLVPRYADEAAGGGVQVDPRTVQSLGMRLATVTRESLAGSVQAAGTLGFNERDVAVVQTRAAGYVERVYARAPGDVVAAGAPLADLLVPEWAGAQQEYLAVRATGDAALTAAARQRLALLGMDEALVAEIERSGRPRAVFTVTSPIAGMVQELMVRQGMTMAPMMTLARINGLATLWLEVAVPEVQAALVQPGRKVQARFAAWPGEVFDGRVAAVLPEAQRETRSLRVRVELPNRGGRLRAGLYAQVAIAGAASTVLVVPSEAVIRTGERALVFVAGAKPGQFSAQPVQLGAEIGDKLVVLLGLAEGQQVVASGQFLVDSESSLSGAVARNPAAPASAASAAAVGPLLHQVNAVVESVEGAEIVVEHEPVPALKWPAMSMPFALQTPTLGQGLKAGDKVRLRFSAEGSGPVVHRIDRLGPAAAPQGTRP